jgi:hypothetical protein
MYTMSIEDVEVVSGGQSDALTASEVMLGVAVAAASPVVAGVAAAGAIAAAGLAIYEELK